MENNQKKVVHYLDSMHNHIKVGSSAKVFPVDHPACSNKRFVETSTVLSYDAKTGSFETLNSQYVRVKSIDN